MPTTFPLCGPRWNKPPHAMPIADSAKHQAVADAVHAFGVGPVAAVSALSGGYIHGSWLVDLDDGRRAVAQQINRAVFTDIDACEDTLDRVVRHLATSDVAVPLHLRTRSHALHYEAGDGAIWRMTWFVEGSHALAAAPATATAEQAAALFGRYDAALADLPGGLPRPTIPHFHDLAFRRAQLESAVDHDRLGRAASCRHDIATARRVVAELLSSLDRLGPLPLRPTHGDAKMANLRFSNETRRPVVVLDLDTTMMAPVLVDLGELLRSGSTDLAEDGADNGHDASVDEERVAAIVRGFLDGLGPSLLPVERQSFRHAGPRMSIFNGIRFLADHLSGDTYYAIERAGQNLDRARTQLALASHLADLAEVVSDIAS
jgi:Ser/Thr protein kinase RdoA (MazF antagonist)